MGDAGIVNQRYELVLVGNNQRLELQSWQIEEARNVKMPFTWQADKWYHLKLEVTNLPDGKVLARGKVWPKGEAEPAKWTIERTDPIGTRMGAAGIFADSPNEILFDNIKVSTHPVP